MSASTPENAVKRQIKAWLKTVPGCWFYSAAAGPWSVAGIPDIICCIKGLFVAIEVKAPGKCATATAMQKAVVARINGAGGFAMVTDNLFDLQLQLKARGIV